MAWTDEFVAKTGADDSWVEGFVEPKKKSSSLINTDMFFGEQDKQAVSETLGKFGNIAKDPMSGVGGLIEFFGNLPAFGAGVFEGGQRTLGESVHEISEGEFNPKELVDAFKEGFGSGYEKLKFPFKALGKNPELVGETIMAPWLAYQKLTEVVKGSNTFKNIPQGETHFRDNIEGLLDFTGNLAGLYLAHGLTSPGGGAFLGKGKAAKIIEKRELGEGYKETLKDLVSDLKSDISKEFKIDPTDVRLKTPEGRQELIELAKSDFEKLNPDKALKLRKNNQQELGEVEGLPEGGETARTTIEQQQKARDFIRLQDQVTANEIAGARPIGDIIREVTGRIKETPASKLFKDFQEVRETKQRIEEKPSSVISGQSSITEANKAAKLATERQRGLMRELEAARKRATKDVKPESKPFQDIAKQTEDLPPLDVEREFGSETFAPDPKAKGNAIDKFIDEKFPPEAIEPKTDLPPVKKFNESNVAKADGVESIVVDGVTEYDLYGKRKFATEEEAYGALSNEKKLVAKQEEMFKNGLELEVIQVGDKFRFAESMDIRKGEENLIRNYLESKGGVKEIDPATAETQLRSLGEEVKEWHQGNEAIDIEGVKEQIAKIGSNFSGGKTVDPMTSFLVDASDRMFSLINEKQKAELAPVEGKFGPGIISAKSPVNPKADFIYNVDGKVFPDMIEAAEFLEDFRLDGLVEPHPEGGWVIEVGKKPKPVQGKRTIKNILKDIKTAIPKVKSNPNTLGMNFIEFEKLPKEKIEALRRLAEDARRARKSVYELAKELGFSELEAKQFDSLIREMATKTNMAKPSVGTEDFQTGERVNEVNNKKVGGYLVENIPVFEGELRALQDIKDPIRTGSGIHTNKYVTTRQKIKELESPFMNQLERTYHELKAIEIDLIADHAKTLVDHVNTLLPKNRMFKKIKEALTHKELIKSSEQIGTFLAWRQKDIRARLERDGFTEADIPVMNEAQNNFITNYLDPTLKLRGAEINRMRVRAGRNPMKLIEEDYFTVAYMEGRAAEFGMKPDIVSEPASLVQARYKSFMETPIKFKKTRSKEGLKKQMNFDAVSIFDNYMRTSIHHEVMTPFIAKLQALREPLKTGEFKKLKDGKTKEINFELKIDKPALDDWINGWANTIAGRDPSAFLSLADTFEHRVLETKIRKVGSNIVGALMSASIRAAEIQVGAFRNTVAKIGKRSTAYGIKEAAVRIANGSIGELKKYSPILKTRLADIDMAEYFSGVRKSNIAAATKIGLTPLGYVDYGTAAATWLGAENFAHRLIDRYKRTGRRTDLNNLKHHGIDYGGEISREVAARRFADNVVIETQGSSLAGDIAPIQRSAIGRILHLFQTFTISDWNFMYKDILGLGPGPKIPLRIKGKRVLDAIIATTILNTFFEDVIGINSPLPTPLRAAMKGDKEGKDTTEIIIDVLKEFGEPLPLVGGAFKAGFSAFGALVQTTDEMLGAFSDKDNRSSLLPKSLDKGALRKLAIAGEAGLKLRGIPGTGQASKMIRAAKRGETPYGIVQGSYSKKKKKKSFRY